MRRPVLSAFFLCPLFWAVPAPAADGYAFPADPEPGIAFHAPSAPSAFAPPVPDASAPPVPAPTAADFVDVRPEPPSGPATGLWGLLAALGASAAAWAVWLLRWAKKWTVDRWENARRAAEFLEAAGFAFEAKYADALARAKADGVVTNDEMRAVLRAAADAAVGYARAHGFDLAKTYAAEYLPVALRAIMGRSAGGAGGGAGKTPLGS